MVYKVQKSLVMCLRSHFGYTHLTWNVFRIAELIKSEGIEAGFLEDEVRVVAVSRSCRHLKNFGFHTE